MLMYSRCFNEECHAGMSRRDGFPSRFTRQGESTRELGPSSPFVREITMQLALLFGRAVFSQLHWRGMICHHIVSRLVNAIRYLLLGLRTVAKEGSYV